MDNKEIVWCGCEKPKIRLTWGVAPFTCDNCNKPIKPKEKEMNK